MPAALENNLYQTVNQLLPGELEEIGKTYNFICIDKTLRDKIYQFKARTIRQTITCYMQSGTVRLQPGGNTFHRETIYKCVAKDLALMMDNVNHVADGGTYNPKYYPGSKRKRSLSEQGRSLPSRSPIITRRKSVPRKLCEEDFSPEVSPVKHETKEDEAFNELFGWIDEKGRRSISRSRRPAKRLRYTFDDDDQEKLEKLEKSREEKTQPEINEPGVVENRRQLKMNKSPITSSGYLESKVIKLEEEKPLTAATSTPKKKSKAKLKEASRKTKETLARLETKLERALNKKVDTPTSLIQCILSCFLGYKRVNDPSLMSTSKPTTPGGKQIYNPYFSPTTCPEPNT